MSSPLSSTDDASSRPNLNAEVARLFAEIGDILELKGEPVYRYNAYRTAARSVAAATEPLDALFARGQLRTLRGVGDALEAKIIEYLSTGRMEFHERVRRDFPVALTSLLQVPGLGPSKARAIYRDLGVSSVAELEQAARDGRLQAVPGFGDKLAEHVLASLAQLKQRAGRGLLSDAWLAAAQVREVLGTPEDGPEALVVVGSARRMQDTVGGLDLLAARDDDDAVQRLLDGLVRLPNLVEVRERTAEQAVVRLYGGLDVRLIGVPRRAFGCALVWYTGARAHVARLEGLAQQHGWRFGPDGLIGDRSVPVNSEEDVYAALDLPWIAPELREDEGEIEAAQAGTLPTLIELADIKGDLHSHSDWTDGTQSLEEMAKAARARGYQYLAVTDHTRNLTVARGLGPERLAEQRALVQRLNHALAPFVILHGTELDILLDGRLDFTDSVLETLDYVGVSVHTGFRQAKAEMTERMLRAISNPLVHTLNHAHGRKIGQRDGYALDTLAVLEGAARLGCALELNASPARLDLNGTWARQARRFGARFTISSDAHSTAEFERMPFGVGSARRGWLEAADVLNTRPLDELRALLGARRSGERARA